MLLYIGIAACIVAWLVGFRVSYRNAWFGATLWDVVSDIKWIFWIPVFNVLAIIGGLVVELFNIRIK